MAARGYWQAFQQVKESIQKILSGDNAGRVAEEDHVNWYRQLFEPSVIEGILKPEDLAGYRTHQVYIGGSKHVPINVDALPDVMPFLFELLESEPEASVRAVLGHFFFFSSLYGWKWPDGAVSDECHACIGGVSMDDYSRGAKG